MPFHIWTLRVFLTLLAWICSSLNLTLNFFFFLALCAEGYEYLDGKCYTKIAGLRSKRDQANTLCSLRQARLPIVENAAEANYLEMMSGADDTWIGYQDDLVEGTWQWDDGSAAGYTNWMSGKQYTQ